MDLAISAVTGDLASRFISFLMNKYADHLCSEDKAERLQQLLLRAHTVVEEADGRCITNSCMLMQLKKLSTAMYQGYHALDNFRYRQHKEASKDLVSASSTSSPDYIIPFKRARTTNSSSTNKASDSGLQSALQSLEAVVDHMVEFVVLLGGCERVSRRPYDAYLHVDNFMFGRHVEKQQIVNFLLQENMPGPPAVLPVVGGRGVGKRTLVAHVCRYDRVRSQFAVILHLSGGDGLTRMTGHEIPSGKTLVVVEFASDVNDDDWNTFYSSVAGMETGSKVIILGRSESLKKIGTVGAISLDCLAFEEYRYLVKTLAFGSANPGDHPRLATIMKEFAVVLDGSLVSANLLGYAVRKNLNAHFWLSTLNKIRIMRKMNMSRSGCHPNGLFDQDHPVHLDPHHLLSPATRLIPSAICLDSSLPKVILGDILAEPGQTVQPKGDFRLISWESRLPPHTAFAHLVRFVPSCVDDKLEASLSGKKRPGPSA